MRPTGADLAQATASARSWRRASRLPLLSSHEGEPEASSADVAVLALFLEGLDVLPRRCCHGGLRRTSLSSASRRSSNRQIARFHTLGGKPRPDRAGGGRAWRRLALVGRPTAVALVGPRRGRLARAQRRRPPLLDRPRVAPDRGKISGHRRRFPGAGGIMFPQESRARGPNFPRAAVARVAGIGEYLRGRLPGVEIRLGLRRRIRRHGGSGDDPRHDSSNPRHDQSSITADAETTFCFEFLAKRGCDLSAPSWPSISFLTSCNLSHCGSQETLF